MAAGAVKLTVKNLPLHITSPIYSFYSWLFPAELRLLASCHMDGAPLFFVVFLFSAVIKPTLRYITSPIYSSYSWPLTAVFSQF